MGKEDYPGNESFPVSLTDLLYFSVIMIFSDLPLNFLKGFWLYSLAIIFDLPETCSDIQIIIM